MVLRHKKAQRRTGHPVQPGVASLGTCLVVPHRARVTNPSQDVRRQVKVARSERGWTQKDLAREARVSRGSVQNLETGMKLDETTEAKIEAALGKPPGWLDDLRAQRAPVPEQAAAEPEIIDVATATLADLQREYVHFMELLSPAEMERLYRLCELYHHLQVRINRRSEGGERSHA